MTLQNVFSGFDRFGKHFLEYVRPEHKIKDFSGLIKRIFKEIKYVRT